MMRAAVTTEGKTPERLLFDELGFALTRKCGATSGAVTCGGTAGRTRLSAWQLANPGTRLRAAARSLS